MTRMVALTTFSLMSLVLNCCPRMYAYASEDGCKPGAEMIGSLEQRPLCYDAGKRRLDVIKFNIQEYGIKIDFLLTKRVLSKLAEASRADIRLDRENTNFGIIIATHEARFDMADALSTFSVVDPVPGVSELEKELQGFQKQINDDEITSGTTHTVFKKTGNKPIYIFLMVRDASERPVFLATDIRDAMMDSLGLSFGKRAR